MTDLEVVKSGTTWLELSIGRNARGLTVHAKCVPELETFVKSLGSGQAMPASAYGRDWLPIDPYTSLQVYDLAKPTGNFRLTKVSEPFMSREGVLNLAFLRLVGLSSPEGVKFVIPGPAPKSFVTDLSADLLKNCRDFIREFLVPVHINLRISSQPV